MSVDELVANTAYLKIIGLSIGLALSSAAVAYAMSSLGGQGLQSIARQPKAAEDIKSAMRTPMMLLESLFVLVWVLALLIVFMKL